MVFIDYTFNFKPMWKNLVQFYYDKTQKVHNNTDKSQL